MNKLRPKNWPPSGLGLLALCAVAASSAPLFAPPSAEAAPRRTLELWPGQRVLLVLPLKVGPDWNAGPELAEAIQPVIRPQLQRALTDTGKFSVTLPYRFDPILRRAVSDKRLSDDVVSALVANPTLETAQPVFSNLTFNQVPMVADVQMEELRVGGTQKKPTVQLVMSGRLYEIGGNGPFRNVTVTSRSFAGRTPADRLQAAANDAFQEIAQQFVAPPAAFELPLPPAPVAPAPKPKAPTGSGATTPNGGSGRPLTAAPGSGGVNAAGATPNTLSPAPGGAFVPQLPPAQPPLGIAVPQEPTLAR